MRDGTLAVAGFLRRKGGIVEKGPKRHGVVGSLELEHRLLVATLGEQRLTFFHTLARRVDTLGRLLRGRRWLLVAAVRFSLFGRGWLGGWRGGWLLRGIRVLAASVLCMSVLVRLDHHRGQGESKEDDEATG